MGSCVATDPWAAGGVASAGEDFHLLVEVPKRPAPDQLPDDKELIRKVRNADCCYDAATLAQDFERLRAEGEHGTAEELRERFFARMWDVSWFLRLLKQRFTQWFNSLYSRTGTLWEGRSSPPNSFWCSNEQSIG